jgi:hypothetical protein
VDVGLVTFARVPRDVAEAMVPPHRSKYSKRLFTQPELLADLSHMRYEDWA